MAKADGEGHRTGLLDGGRPGAVVNPDTPARLTTPSIPLLFRPIRVNTRLMNQSALPEPSRGRCDFRRRLSRSQVHGPW